MPNPKQPISAVLRTLRGTARHLMRPYLEALARLDLDGRPCAAQRRIGRSATLYRAADQLEKLQAFAENIARMTDDQEFYVGFNGKASQFHMSTCDAFDTISRLIVDARELTGQKPEGLIEHPDIELEECA